MKMTVISLQIRNGHIDVVEMDPLIPNWYQTIPLYTQILHLFSFLLTFEGARTEKELKIWPFKTLKESFFYAFSLDH